TAAGNPEAPFNLPLMAYASGATYIARWTMLHTRDLTEYIEDAINKKGFSFVEVLSPCPINYGRRNREKSIETLKKYNENTIIKNGADPSELEIDFDKGVVLGKFIDIDKPTHDEKYRKLYETDQG
ncbi:MAG: 2-oxoacid:ferredoxin oxidoreductase subunit beta, partial [Deltaproteobacteria bacterium]|nr:2-oxoacid:ferredoxin oxidoreductase subunit beta [Deltaproteobacteria bacterium]